MSYTLPKLTYTYNELEPYFDERTMEIHHSKHHNAYINKLNTAIENSDLDNKNLSNLLSNLSSVPVEIRTTVRNNGGGHANHSFFWTILSPNGGGAPTGELSVAIDKELGGFEAFKNAFAAAGVNRFGSGWVWLIVRKDGSLAVISTPNQDTPLMVGTVEHTGTPVIGLDVWEHAYYLKYQNLRPQYIEAFWNVVDWNVAAENYQKALS